MPRPFPHHLPGCGGERHLFRVDPQGEALTFRVTKNPARGSVTLAEEGSARFTYTPYENKTGRIRFPMWQWTRRATSPSRGSLGEDLKKPAPT